MEYKGKKHERKQTFQMAYIIGGKNNISNRERRIRSRNCKRGRKKISFHTEHGRKKLRINKEQQRKQGSTWEQIIKETIKKIR